MDRLGFLSSMPFLVPANTFPRSSAGKKVETLIAPQESYQYKLSVEPTVAPEQGGSENNSSLEDIYPAFFVRPLVAADSTKNNNAEDHNNNDSAFDPSMANIQVVIEAPPTAGTTAGNGEDEPSELQARVLFGEKQQRQQQQQQQSQSSTSTSLSHHKSTKKLQIQSQPSADGPFQMFFKIDEGIFRVDGRQLLHAELIHSPKNREKASSELPPSLLLVFPCCVFRIFPLPNPNPAPGTDFTQKQNWKEQASEALELLQKCILQLSQATLLFAAAANNWSPTGSSSVHTSSNEGGQKGGLGAQQQHQSHSHSTMTSSSSSARGPKKFKGMPKDYDNTAFQDNHQIRKVKRCRSALWRSLAGLQAAETILCTPIANCTTDSLLANAAAAPTTNMSDSAMSEGAEPRTQLHGNNNLHVPLDESLPFATASTNKKQLDIRPLLSGVTEELTNAYGSQQEVMDVMQMYQHEIDETRNSQLDSLLNSFFPEKRHASSGKKNRRLSATRRNNNKQTVNNYNDDEGPESLKPAEEVMESMKKLMKKKEELFEEKSSLLMLPTRS